jgi:hypothetical protein
MGSGFKAQGARYKVQCARYKVQGSEFKGSRTIRCRVSGFRRLMAEDRGQRTEDGGQSGTIGDFGLWIDGA